MNCIQLVQRPINQHRRKIDNKWNASLSTPQPKMARKYFFRDFGPLIIRYLALLSLSNYGEKTKPKNKSEIEILTRLVKTWTDTDFGRKSQFQPEWAQEKASSLNLIPWGFWKMTFLPMIPYFSTFNIYTSTHAFSPLDQLPSKLLKSEDWHHFQTEIRNKECIAVYDSQYDFFLKAEDEEFGWSGNKPHEAYTAGRFKSDIILRGKDKYFFEGSHGSLDFESLKTDQEYHYFYQTQQIATRSIFPPPGKKTPPLKKIF